MTSCSCALCCVSVGMKVPEEYISKMGDIADNLPLAYILPSTSGPGLCTLALMDFLLFQQNELLEFCRNSCKFSRYIYMHGYTVYMHACINCVGVRGMGCNIWWQWMHACVHINMYNI